MKRPNLDELNPHLLTCIYIATISFFVYIGIFAFKHWPQTSANIAVGLFGIIVFWMIYTFIFIMIERSRIERSLEKDIEDLYK